MTTYPINNNYKICRRCKLKKKISEFSVDKVSRFLASGEIKEYSYFRECIKCKKERFRLLDTKYRDRKNVYTKEGSIKWSSVLKELKKRAEKNNTYFNIDKKEFIDWKNKQSDTCTYCDLTLKQAKKVLFSFYTKGSTAISKRFQIDRKNNDKAIGYTLDNICFACVICNSHKGDFYSHKEFKEIADRFIRPLFDKILYKNI